MNKNPLLAFILSIAPGIGHLYLGRMIRAFFYAAGFFGPIFLIIAFGLGHDERTVLLSISFVCWIINLIDMVVFLLTRLNQTPKGSDIDLSVPRNEYNERIITILLSFVPGLGHFQLGLMYRGLTFLVGFFGLLTMVVFVSIITSNNKFLVFLGALPILWLFSLFDAVQLVHRKQRGEEIADRSIFDELEEGWGTGKKSKVIATLLSVFPGAGHMYLGLQRRGIQLMGSFLFSIYVLDTLRLSFFLFLIPLIWFFSLFDALQHVSKHGQEEMKDIPIVDWLINHQKWLGIGLVLLGAYYLLDQFVLQMLEQIIPNVRIGYWFHQYFQTLIVSFLFIAGGLRLLYTSKRKKGNVKSDRMES